MVNGTKTESKALLDADFVRRLERLAIAAKRVQLGRAKGERKSKRKGISVEFADYRDYVQGDDLRHIDWNIYGRLDALYLKLFQEQEDLTVHLLVDSSQSMAYGQPGKIEFAAKLAAAIGYIGLTGYDRVSVEAFAGSRRQVLRPVRGKGNANRLFSFLSGFRREVKRNSRIRAGRMCCRNAETVWRPASRFLDLLLGDAQAHRSVRVRRVRGPHSRTAGD